MAEAGIPPEIAAMSFEDALNELQALVKTLERGESKLDEAILAYERGDALKRHCESKLREAQMKVDRIVQGPDGDIETRPAKLD
jgi:exodeoxyribonuclease VII small subunit